MISISTRCLLLILYFKDKVAQQPELYAFWMIIYFIIIKYVDVWYVHLGYNRLEYDGLNKVSITTLWGTTIS